MESVQKKMKLKIQVNGEQQQGDFFYYISNRLDSFKFNDGTNESNHSWNIFSKKKKPIQ